MIAIAIQIRNQLFFYIIFISRVYDAIFIATFKININVVATYLHSFCLAPINFLNIVAIFIFFQNSVSKFLHDRNINACHFCKNKAMMFTAN